jgi:CYTH domain-containing protein
MSTSLEIERKFLLEAKPDLEPLRQSHLRQGYIATGDTEVRLRSDGRSHQLTCKRGSGLTRLEQEVEISDEQFEALWPLTEAYRIDKTRYYYEHRGHLIELDVYHGRLEPLVVAEIEFDSEESSRLFEAPPYFGEEVTHDQRYKNKMLAQKGLPT